MFIKFNCIDFYPIPIFIKFNFINFYSIFMFIKPISMIFIQFIRLLK